jgi:hypothetical protein
VPTAIAATVNISAFRLSCIDALFAPHEKWRTIMNIRILAAAAITLSALSGAAFASSDSVNGNSDKCPGGFDPATSQCPAIGKILSGSNRVTFRASTANMVIGTGGSGDAASAKAARNFNETVTGSTIPLLGHGGEN